MIKPTSLVHIALSNPAPLIMFTISSYAASERVTAVELLARYVALLVFALSIALIVDWN